MNQNRHNILALVFLILVIGGPTFAQDSQPSSYKKLPPDGIEISAQQRRQLTKRVEDLRERLQDAVDKTDDSNTWRADVEVLVRAVDLALSQNLFFKKNETGYAAKLLVEASQRLESIEKGDRGLKLIAGKTDPRLVVGGFVSRIDDSVQPYGIVLPTDYDADKSYRLDVWLHGRGDTKMEIAFLNERMTKVGQYAPNDTIVLHPFGRHCNAFKFAGETDVYESIAHVKSRFNIDTNRISIRGFSMGGAGCWHLAVHDPTRWFAANPGAGFVDTIKYQGWADRMPFELGEARKRTMQLYDVLPWTSNLTNTKLIAYSGEVDKQRQAADRVIEKLNKGSEDWKYVIGKGMGHKIDPDSKTKIDAQLDEWASAPAESPRKTIDFTTYTVRYANADWLSVTGLKEQWSPGHVTAKITPSNNLEIKTDGITHLKLDFKGSGWPGKREVGLNIDGERFYIADTGDADGLQCNLVRTEQWDQVVGEDPNEIRKKPGVQGPIDDAFRDRFLFVLPSRPAANGVVERWVDHEIAYATNRWQRLMRGNVRVVKDIDLTDDQIKHCHLICFGDFLGNRYLAKIASRLPLKWTRDELKVGDKTYDASTHAPAFCFPNPKNPNRYVVINSGMTFREFSNVSNSRQIAMLPDWAVFQVDDEHDDSIFAGKVVAEGFFDENWQLK